MSDDEKIDRADEVARRHAAWAAHKTFAESEFRVQLNISHKVAFLEGCSSEGQHWRARHDALAKRHRELVEAVGDVRPLGGCWLCKADSVHKEHCPWSRRHRALEAERGAE